jgi:hypothetical protein
LLTIGVIAFVASTTIAWLLVVKKQKKLAITLSAVMCFYFPFGTILGVITILALRNPLTKTKFELQRVTQTNKITRTTPPANQVKDSTPDEGS